jgi:hypothetical protein
LRSFYKVTTLLRDRLQSNQDVNTVTFGVMSESDFQKKNIYPLVNIMPTNASLDNANVNSFDFEISAVDQRDLSDDEIKDKFLSNDNSIDNLNLCHAILNDLVTYLRNLYNDDGIELITASNMTPLYMDGLNIMDGWTLTITLEIPNITISACE